MPVTATQPKRTAAEMIALGYKAMYGSWIPPLQDKITGKVIKTREGKPIPQPDFTIEAAIFRGDLKVKEPRDKFHHFKMFVNALWGDRSDMDGYFEWNPNAERIVREALKMRKFLAVAGAASTGKTQALALYAVAKFLIQPENTKVLATSMTITSAEGKVWGHIEKYWNRAAKVVGNAELMPGKLISSNHIIRRKTDEGKLSSTEGIELVPAEASQYKTSAKKLQGYKSTGSLIVVGDEFATLAPALLQTCIENLSVNTGFQLIGAFNPESHFDPGGMLSEPKAGWKSIDMNTDEWETKLGYCIRFDGMKSPNVLDGRATWLGLMTLESLNHFKSLYNNNESSIGFCKMVRGFWSATGSKESIFTEAEMEEYEVMRKVKNWLERPTMVAGFDPSFTHGGDRAVLVIGQVGEIPAGDGRKRVFERVETYVLDADVDRGKDKNEQIVDKVHELLGRHKVSPENVCVDISGAAAFGTLLAQKIGPGFIGVNFGGGPTEMRVSNTDKRTGKEAYVNRVSELWFGVKPLVRSGQIYGLDPDTILELCARSYCDRAGKVEIESKERMKERTKKSPDLGDAFCLACDAARIRASLTAAEVAPKKTKPSTYVDPIYADLFPKPRIRTALEQFTLVGQGGSGWGD